MTRLFVSVLFLLFSFYSFADFDFSQNCKAAYSEIFRLRFDYASKYINAEKIDNPSNGIIIYLENYIDFMKAIISEDKNYYLNIKNTRQARLEAIENCNKNSPYLLYCLSDIYLQSAFASIKFRDYLSAGIALAKALRYAEINNNKFPDFKPNYKCFGMVNIILGAVPDEYKWIAAMFNLNGDIAKGTQQLEFLLNSASSLKNPYFLLKEEFVFILSFVYINFCNDDARLIRLADMIADDYRTSPLMSFSLARIYMKSGKNNRVIDVLSRKPSGSEFFPFLYLDYLFGLAKLNRLDNDADIAFIKFLNGFKGINYIKSAYQKLAWHYLLKGEIDKYEKYKNKILSNGFALTDEDKQAEKEAKYTSPPNTILLKSRLLCDGGYYRLAISALVNHDTNSYLKGKKDYIEFTYRLARAFDQWNKQKEAVIYYERTIANGSNSKYYFAANSALHLALIYEKNNNPNKAEFYFRKCLSFKNEEYRNSIRQKAKAGLSRLRDY